MSTSFLQNELEMPAKKTILLFDIAREQLRFLGASEREEGYTAQNEISVMGWIRSGVSCSRIGPDLATWSLVFCPSQRRTCRNLFTASQHGDSIIQKVFETEVI